MQRLLLIFVFLMVVSAGAVHARLQDGARYLIIAPDEFVDAVAPLARWKTATGMQAKVVPVSVAGGVRTISGPTSGMRGPTGRYRRSTL